jgi:hypothetical protein
MSKNDLIYFGAIFLSIFITNPITQLIYIGLIATIYLNNGSRTDTYLQDRIKSKRTGSTSSITGSFTLPPVS